MIEDYIDHVSEKRDEIGGHAICPYAKSFIKKTKLINSNNLMYSAFDCLKKENHPMLSVIYGDPVKHDDVWCNLFCSHYQSYANKKDLWLIWDHPNNKNNINGVRTNNTEYAIILIQRLGETKRLSDNLQKTNYYNFWDNKYFKEIVLERAKL